MKKILLSILACLLLAAPAMGALTENPTTPAKTDKWLNLTTDGSTAFDLGWARTINYVIWKPAAAGETTYIRDGSATAPWCGLGKSVDGSSQIIYITGAVRPYIKANETSSGDIYIFSFK